MKYTSFLLSIILFLSGNILMAQSKDYLMPSLDEGKNNVALKFNEEAQYPGISTSYMIGTTEKDTLRFPVKNIGFDLIPFKVMVISPDPAQTLTVMLVKNNWKGIVKTATTTDGLFMDEFRTAGEFGIMITGAKPGVPFRLGVYKGPVIKRTSALFIPAADFNAGNTNSSGINNAEAKGEKSGSNSLIWVISIAALIIIGLLVFIIVKRTPKKNETLLLFFLAASHVLLSSLGTPAGRAGFVQGIKGMSETLQNTFGGATDLLDFKNKVNDAMNGYGDYKNLDESDSQYEPDMDPNGQPSLPSSCLAASPSSSPDANRENNRQQPSADNNDDELTDRDNKYDNKPPNSSGSAPVMGEVITSSAGSGRIPIEPKYDKNGNLISAGDYPNAPTKVALDPQTGEPILPVFSGRNTTGNSSPREPKYDKDGRLTDAGDFPNAPTRVPLDPETGEPQISDHSPRYSPSGEKPDELSANKPNASNSGNRSNTSSRNNNNNNNGNNNSEGCKCLQEAYAKLEETRYKFEKLAVILNSTSKYTTASLALGDNVSGIHAVSGMAWQNERVKIVKSYEEFQKAYDDRYKQLVQELYDNLMRIDKCELKLGFENWYSIAGFMYYEFAKARYNRNGK